MMDGLAVLRILRLNLDHPRWRGRLGGNIDPDKLDWDVLRNLL